MKRNYMLSNLESNLNQTWDLIVIGGGATGLGVAVDSASRGYKTLLLEQNDFAKGTSSRSTKLVHGGVRYLAQGDISLVLEALKERGLMKKNAPHLVHDQSFIIPNYKWWDGPFYTLGMKVYDTMAGKLGLGPSIHIDKETTLKHIPTLKEEGLAGGVIYHDGQFDDARLSINLAQTCSEYGGILLNYIQVTGLEKSSEGLITGVKAKDLNSQKEYSLSAKAVINATGVFADNVLKMDEPNAPTMIKPSQGVHIVLDHEFLQGDHAIMIPKTSDGRVLFAVPWHGKVIVGTTDTELDEISLEPRALEEEIQFILETASDYLVKAPKREDVLSIFAGLRPLAAPQEDGASTKEISRSHKLIVSLSGLVTITGGKWTTYRKMAEDTIDKAVMVAGIDDRRCITQNLAIHGYLNNPNRNDPLHIYGSDMAAIKESINANPALGLKFHKKLTYTKAEILWIIEHEMPLTLEDILSRRTRALLMDAKASIEIAPEIAKIMAEKMGKDQAWIDDQVLQYKELAKGYLL